jgi:uncharacterized SAM-dependent methyltransferase
MSPPCRDGGLGRAPKIAAPFDPAFARDVLAGLAAARRSIPCAWLYEHRGSERVEAIHTENSYQCSLPGLQALARRAGGLQRQPWSDVQSRFAVHVLERPAAARSAA